MFASLLFLALVVLVIVLVLVLGLVALDTRRSRHSRQPAERRGSRRRHLPAPEGEKARGGNREQEERE